MRGGAAGLTACGLLSTAGPDGPERVGAGAGAALLLALVGLLNMITSSQEARRIPNATVFPNFIVQVRSCRPAGRP